MKKATLMVAWLKCIHTNACSTGNKQEELEATTQLENYDLIAIAEMWWDESQNWSMMTKGYKFNGRDR